MKSNKRSQTEPIADESPSAEEYVDAPTPEEIAERAFENYESEGSQDGNDVEHWLTAEARLRAERSF